MPEEESRHAIKSLRLGIDSEIMILNGGGSIFYAKIIAIQKRGFLFKIHREEKSTKPPPLLHVVISPLKSVDRFEWFIEKATELGIDSITPIICTHTFKKRLNYPRLNRIMISGIKQSGNPFLPKLNPEIKFDDYIEGETNKDKYIAYCESVEKLSLKSLTFNNDTTILIGPEGDFEQKELEKAVSHGFKPVSLGSLILRTETAAIAFSANFQLNKT